MPVSFDDTDHEGTDALYKTFIIGIVATAIVVVVPGYPGVKVEQQIRRFQGDAAVAVSVREIVSPRGRLRMRRSVRTATGNSTISSVSTITRKQVKR